MATLLRSQVSSSVLFPCNRPIQVAILAASPSAGEVWERRVGGILKGLGVVRYKFLLREDPVAQIQYLDAKDDCDLIVCYGGGEVTAAMSRHGINSRKIMEVELNILPIGLKHLYTIPDGARVGVVMKHLGCANTLLNEVLKAGSLNKRFISGIIDELPFIKPEYVVVAEEMAGEALQVLKGIKPAPKIINIPRNLAFTSVGRLIAAAQARTARPR